MHIILDETEPGNREIECRHCHWQGAAGEIKKGNYLSLNNITEFYCPSCDSYLGFIQHGPGEEKTGD